MTRDGKMSDFLLSALHLPSQVINDGEVFTYIFSRISTVDDEGPNTVALFVSMLSAVFGREGKQIESVLQHT